MKNRIVATLLAFCMVLVLLPGTALAAIATSGSCGANGDNVTWSLNSRGTLTISGRGKMKDYTYSENVPWCKSRDAVKTVVIDRGVTSIGGMAFVSCTSLTSVTIPDSVTLIGKDEVGSSNLPSSAMKALEP